jgi:hypothetical protein
MAPEVEEGAIPTVLLLMKLATVRNSREPSTMK